MNKLILCAETIYGTDVDIILFQINFLKKKKKLLTSKTKNVIINIEKGKERKGGNNETS